MSAWHRDAAGGVLGDDDAADQMATVTGSLDAGYKAVLQVPVDV